MAKISLSVDIPWPDGKAKLFAEGERSWGVAWLPETDKDWYLYAEGYKEAAEAVFQELEKSDFRYNYLIFPLVFLYRHYLELRLKELLQASARLLHLPKEWQCNHRLDQLWKTLRPLLERIWPDSAKAACDHVEALIAEFAIRDPISMEFRYPSSREGQRHLRELECLDVVNLRSTMQQLATFLDSTNHAIAEYQSIENSL